MKAGTAGQWMHQSSRWNGGAGPSRPRDAAVPGSPSRSITGDALMRGSNKRRQRNERFVDLALAIAYVAACALLGWAGALWSESSLWP